MRARIQAAKLASSEAAALAAEEEGARLRATLVELKRERDRVMMDAAAAQSEVAALNARLLAAQVAMPPYLWPAQAPAPLQMPGLSFGVFNAEELHHTGPHAWPPNPPPFPVPAPLAEAPAEALPEASQLASALSRLAPHESEAPISLEDMRQRCAKFLGTQWPAYAPLLADPAAFMRTHCPGLELVNGRVARRQILVTPKPPTRPQPPPREEAPVGEAPKVEAPEMRGAARGRGRHGGRSRGSEKGGEKGGRGKAPLPVPHQQAPPSQLF